MSRDRTTPHGDWIAWVERGLREPAGERRRRAAWLREQAPRLRTIPLPGSLKGVSEGDLNGWARRLEETSE